MILIRFIKEIKKDFELNNQMFITKIKMELKLATHPSHMKEIVEDLRKRFIKNF